MLISTAGAATYSGSGTSTEVTPGSAAGVASTPTGALALRWDGTKRVVDTSLGDGGYITVYNYELTALRGSTDDPVPIAGEMRGKGSAAAIHVVPSDLRKLPGFDGTADQIPFHAATDDDFQLDGDACA